MAYALKMRVPNWRELNIHESSASDRGISRKMSLEAKHYTATQFFTDEAPGSIIKGCRNENLEQQTFADESFDVVVTLDVMEHVFNPEKVYKEIFRTLKTNGLYIHTFPIYKDRTAPFEVTTATAGDGSIIHLLPPEYHGNPVDDKGSLVTHYYGYDIAREIHQWSGFDVEICRFWDAHHGIMGEFTEVVICRKSDAPTH